MPRTCLVTGGVQGIGRAIVQQFKARGDHVIVFDYIPADDERVVALRNASIDYYVVDISSVQSIRDGFSQIYTDFPDMTLDVLVNNAGVARDNLAIRLKEADWDTVMNVNLKGLFFCCQQALTRMVPKRNGAIINISSIVGQTGNPGQVNYAASKAGVITLTKTLAQEYGSRNIMINAIAPGHIVTQMTQGLPEKIQEYIRSRISLRRFGTPEDVARVVAFLSSDEAAYINGQVINVDGGLF